MTTAHWILAARPKTLVAGLCPVAIGTALAIRDNVAHVPAASAALIGAMAIQIGTNFCNDYFDFFQGADTDQRKGPTRAVQAGLVTPQGMLIATILSFGIATAASAYMTWRAGWEIAFLATVSIAFGVLYTAGRFSLAYLGLGDPFVVVFFGPVAVGGTYYVQALQVPVYVIVAGIAPGVIATALLVVNNLRDIDEDRTAGKRTVAVRFGRTFVRIEYTLCMIVAALIPFGLWTSFNFPVSVLMASVATVPGLIVSRMVWTTDGEALNPYLGKTAAVLFLYSFIFSTGCVLVW